MFDLTSGRNRFEGDSQTCLVEHELGDTPIHVSISPIEPANGHLGEVWYSCDQRYIYIVNTGSFCGEFSWAAFK